jgi:hypothetical protein
VADDDAADRVVADGRSPSDARRAAEDRLREAYNQLLLNAVALLDLYTALDAAPDAPLQAAFEDQLRVLRTEVAAHTARLHDLKLADGVFAVASGARPLVHGEAVHRPRLGERRSGVERRSRMAVTPFNPAAPRDSW